MRCGVLGPLEIRRGDGALVDVPGAKERHLLCLLAAAYPDPVTADELVERLWDGTPPRTARKSLQAHVVRLRTALEPDRVPGSAGRYVVRRHGGYALALEREELDATRFADLVSRGRALMAAGERGAARDLLREALALWRGTPFQEGADALHLGPERVRLEGIRAAAVETYWEAELALGRHAEAVPELEHLVAEEPLHENRWVLLVVAYYRSGRQGEALEALRRARSVLAEELGVDPGPRLRELEQAVLAQDPELDRSPTSPPKDQPDHAQTSAACPYKGLARYEIEDADSFHGRERLVDTLVGVLVDHSTIVVSGSSGAGKSSVVRAGLLPALGSGALPGSQAWEPAVVVPGERAADALASLTGEDAPAGPVLLVCDQLEQLWSPGTDPAERAAFLDTVVGLVDDEVVARCVLLIRGDHLGRLAEHEGYAERMLGGLVMVPTMTELELRQVVEGPARGTGLTVEPELTDAAVRDVLGRSGALPLLSVALAQTWLRRRDGALTLAAYLATGGVTGAVGRSAEQVYAGWSEEERESARRVLVRLAEQDPDGTVRSRPMPVAELGDAAADPATGHVIETLLSARLVARDEEHLEVAHEALLTAWPRLAAWVADDATGRAVRRHLAPAALEWDAHGRPADELYRGARLDAAGQWLAAPGAGASDVERDFVEAGLALSRAELTAARERAEAEAAGRRRTRRFAGLLGAALVLALVATVGAVVYQRRADQRAVEADEASTVADANRLAALSASSRSLDLSMLLAAAAVQTAETPATLDSLLGTLVEHRRATGVYQLSAEGVEETALSADGRWMAIGIGGGSPRVVTWRPGGRAAPRLVERFWWARHLAISPDGDTVVGLQLTEPERISSLRAWTPGGRRLPAPRGPRVLGGSPVDVEYTKEGRLLLVVGKRAGADVGTRVLLREVDLAHGTSAAVRSLGTFPGSEATALEAAFSDDASSVVAWTRNQRRASWMPVPDGPAVRLRLEPRPATSNEFVATPTGALQFWSDGAVTRYDARGRAVQVLDVHRAPVRDATVLGGGRAAVTAGEGGQVELWTIDPRTGSWSLGESLVGHGAAVEQVEISADGRSLLSADRDGKLIVWDLTPQTGFGTTYPGLTDRWVSNRIQDVDPGRLVVAPARGRGPSPSRGTNGGWAGPGTGGVSAVFLDPRDGRVVDEAAVGRSSGEALFGSSVAVSADHRLVAVTSEGAVTVLDTRTRDRVARLTLPLGDARLVWSATWTPDGSKLLLGSEGNGVGEVLVVDTDTWEVVDRFQPHWGSAQVFEWAPDGKTLAIGVNYSGSIDLYDADLRRIRAVELGDGGDVFDLSFSPDGRYLAAGRVGGGVSVLDTDSWRLVHPTATMHSGHVTDVEWLPDSTTVVSTGRDATVSLYDVERDLVRTSPLPASGKGVEGQSFLMPGPDDEVVVLTDEGPGHVYPLDPAQWLGLACAIAGRDLTRAEWDRYLPGRAYEPVCAGLIPEG